MAVLLEMPDAFTSEHLHVSWATRIFSDKLAKIRDVATSVRSRVV